MLGNGKNRERQSPFAPSARSVRSFHREKTFIEAGVAQRNPDFDPEVPNSESILITKPERIPGEDVVNFKNAKADFMKEKQKLLTRLHFEGLRAKPPRPGPSSLGFQHSCRTIKPVWEKHFSKERNKIAWQRIGVVPFTRCVYWDLL